MKISRANALPVGLDTGLGELKRMMETRPAVPVAQKGKIADFDFRAEYISFQKQYLKDLSNLTIAVDCSNGMASMLVHDILGDTPTYIYDTLDGTFPHHEPNPLIEDNCRDLEALVRQVKADVGVIYDGDADRVMFIDERGRFISPDLIIGLMAHYFLEERGLKGNCTQMYSALRAGVGFELPHLLPAHCYEGKVAVGVVCVGFNHSVRESLRGHLAV